MFRRQHRQAESCEAMAVPFAIMGKTWEVQAGELEHPEFPVAHVTSRSLPHILMKLSCGPWGAESGVQETSGSCEWPLRSHQQAVH